MHRIPKPDRRRAASWPIRPKPTKPTAPDSSISIDEDKGTSVAGLIIDAVAAAAAIAFTVLLLQDALPFLK
jgi:hypothetical protein